VKATCTPEQGANARSIGRKTKLPAMVGEWYDEGTTQASFSSSASKVGRHHSRVAPSQLWGWTSPHRPS